MAVIDLDLNFKLHPELKPAGFVADEYSKPLDADAYVGLMDAAGVDRTGVVANVAGLGLGRGGRGRILDEVTADVVQAEIAKHPHRFFGWVGVHPFGGTETIRYIDYAVRTLGFKGVHIYPHWFGVDVNDRLYYPIYSKAAELGVPVAIQLGLGGHRGNRRSVGSPWAADDILYDFPELNLLSLHIGPPFEREFVRLCDNYANLYLVADMPASTWPDVVVERLKSQEGSIDLSERVLWGTNGPNARSPQEALKQVSELGLPVEVEQRVLGGNAQRLLGLDEPS
jgi:predicted TIM-barrel fold metal-dependent hydrolase